MSKRYCSRTLFGSEHVNGSSTLLKYARKHFYLFDSSITDQLCWSMSLLVSSEILGMFVNTLTANDK